MSPVSVFDQRLEEDPRVNRLEDSINLWTSICQSKLLAKTQLILFLNKCDLLRRKLKRGVRVKDFLPSYGSRPNKVTDVVKCKYLPIEIRDRLKYTAFSQIFERSSKIFKRNPHRRPVRLIYILPLLRYVSSSLIKIYRG